MSQNLPTQPQASPGFISPTKPLEFLGFAAVNALVGLLASANPVGFVAVPIIAVSWWWYDRRRAKAVDPIQGISLTKVAPRPAESLILCVSDYSPRRQSLNEEMVQKQIEFLIAHPNPDESDFKKINFFQSNLLPQIKAIEYHVGTLQELWLLPTEESIRSAQLLAKFVRWRFGDKPNIQIENPIPEYDYETLCKVSDRIFAKSKFKEDCILADITSGTKMMSVALAVSCVPQKRRMQYMDMSDGASPVVLDIDPILYGEKV